MTALPSSRRIVAATVLAGALALPLVSVASAHASLVRANIAPGHVYAHNAYPRTLTAFFAENVKPSASFVHVFEADPKGDHALVDNGKLGFPFKNPKEITVGLPAGLKGTYTVMWFTTSADDGHKAGSTFTFTVE